MASDAHKSAWQYPAWLPVKLYAYWRAPRRAVLAACIMGEAEGETYQGKKAVALVVMNRVNAGFRGLTVQEVCLWRHQFSCFWTDFDKRGQIMEECLVNINDPRFLEAYAAADYAIEGGEDITGGALYYFNPKVVLPQWAKKLIRTQTVGRHAFYRDDRVKQGGKA